MDIITAAPQWNGIENYKVALTDVKFWESMLITVKYVVFNVIFVNIIAFALALLVTSGIKGQNFLEQRFSHPI